MSWAKGIWERLKTQGEALQLSTELKTHSHSPPRDKDGERIIWRGRSEMSSTRQETTRGGVGRKQRRGRRA